MGFPTIPFISTQYYTLKDELLFNLLSQESSKKTNVQTITVTNPTAFFPSGHRPPIIGELNDPPKSGLDVLRREFEDVV